MNSKQIREKVLSLTETDFQDSNLVDSLVVLMMEFDEEAFEKLYSVNIVRTSFESFFINIIFPFLERIGYLWQTSVIKTAHEHFITNLIRQKIISAIDTINPSRKTDAGRYLLFLPERELHELGILFMNYVIRSRQNYTLYLGASVPIEDILTAYEEFHPDFLVTSAVSFSAVSTYSDYLSCLSDKFPHNTIIALGKSHQTALPKILKNIILTANPGDAISLVDEFSQPLTRSNHSRLVQVKNRH